MVIANFIVSKALPFSTSEDILFKQMMLTAKLGSKNYIPPKRKHITDELMTLLHNKYIENSEKELKTNVMFFGLSILGDGAALHKVPLFNVLVSGLYCPVYVHKIYGCTEDFTVGENKNGEFLARFFKTTASKIDPNKLFLDVLFVDGASNVQLAGQCLNYLYPSLTVIHGCEHVLSLFCSNLFK